MLLPDRNEKAMPLTYLKRTNCSDKLVSLWECLMLVDSPLSFCFLPCIGHSLWPTVHNGDWCWLEGSIHWRNLGGIPKEGQKESAVLMCSEDSWESEGHVGALPHISHRFNQKRPWVLRRLPSSSWVLQGQPHTASLPTAWSLGKELTLWCCSWPVLK